MKKKITIGEDLYIFSIEDFDEDVDVDSLLKIDYSNLIGELLTFPIIVNRFGVMLAEMESKVSEAKLNLEIFEAKKKEEFRVSLTAQNNGKGPTVEALNNAIMVDKVYQVFRKKHIEAQKSRDYLFSTYLAAKDKSSKLDKLSLSIQKGDISEDSLQGKINGILITKKEKLVK